MISPLSAVGSGYNHSLASSVASANKNNSAITQKFDHDSDDSKTSSTVGNSGSAQKSTQLLDIKG